MKKGQEGWRKILVGAIRVLTKNSWIIGSLRDNKGGFCTLGAMIEAKKELQERKSPGASSPDYEKATRIVDEILKKERIHEKWASAESNIADWNDHVASSKEEVLKVLAKAAHYDDGNKEQKR